MSTAIDIAIWITGGLFAIVAVLCVVVLILAAVGVPVQRLVDRVKGRGSPKGQ